MGAQQAGLLATDIFREIGQERVKISCKCPDIAFVSNSPRKHRQGLGKEIVPWNVACIQISSLFLSLSHSISQLLPQRPSLSVLVQVGISHPGEQSISFTKIFHQSSKLLSNMKAFFLK